MILEKALSICKIQLLHTIPYRAIYRCIVIQYINTPKMCIIASLIHTHIHIHTYKHTHMHTHNILLCYGQVDILISKHHALHILFHV